jgi:predicted RNA-binding protein
MATKRLGLSLVGLLAFAGAALAEEIHGVITKVDLDHHQVVVEGRGRGMRKGAYTLTLDKDSQIVQGRKTAEPAGLEVGRRVRVLFEMQDGQRVARVIHLRGPSTTKEDDRGITGTIQRVALKEHKLVIHGRQKRGGAEIDINFELPAEVRVTRAGKAIKVDDLEEGLRVRILPEERDGKMLAGSIEVVEEKEALIPRIRRVLQLADIILKLAENK